MRDRFLKVFRKWSLFVFVSVFVFVIVFVFVCQELHGDVCPHSRKSFHNPI